MRQAKRDLENAEYELKGGFFEWSCFLSQQAAEKAIKAVFQRIHAEAFGNSVSVLLEKLPRAIKPAKSMIDMARELDRAYVAARYPNEYPEGAPYEFYTKEEATRLLKYAKEIVEYCEGILSRVK
jgi:HEPN domain-containing protein